MFNVEIEGKPYDEMHVDGSVLAQFFVPLKVINLPEAIRAAQKMGFKHKPRPRMYVIRNSRFEPESRITNRRLTDIAGRSLLSMTHAMGRSDLYQIFAISKARGKDFHYVEIPPSFEWKSKQEFDGAEMRRLYDICLLYTSPSPRDRQKSRMPSSA